MFWLHSEPVPHITVQYGWLFGVGEGLLLFIEFGFPAERAKCPENVHLIENIWLTARQMQARSISVFCALKTNFAQKEQAWDLSSILNFDTIFGINLRGWVPVKRFLC